MNLAVAQFQPKDGDKAYNLSIIRNLTEKAKAKGAEVICFHEMSITAYTFVKDLSLEEITDLAEDVPGGKSTKELINISREFDLPILAGLAEKEQGKIFNTYICVTKDGVNREA
jgi:predicted amidohydrolase